MLQKPAFAVQAGTEAAEFAVGGYDPVAGDDKGDGVGAAGLADRFEIELAYTIGVARPASISVETFGTGKVGDDRILAAIEKHFDLRPAGIIETLDLRRPIFRPTAAYGHFGRTDHDFTWERTDKAAALADECGLKPSGEKVP